MNRSLPFDWIANKTMPSRLTAVGLCFESSTLSMKSKSTTPSRKRLLSSIASPSTLRCGDELKRETKAKKRVGTLKQAHKVKSHVPSWIILLKTMVWITVTWVKPLIKVVGAAAEMPAPKSFHRIKHRQQREHESTESWRETEWPHWSLSNKDSGSSVSLSQPLSQPAFRWTVGESPIFVDTWVCLLFHQTAAPRKKGSCWEVVI